MMGRWGGNGIRPQYWRGTFNIFEIRMEVEVWPIVPFRPWDDDYWFIRRASDRKWAGGRTFCMYMMTSSNGIFFALLAFVRGIHRLPVDSPHKGQWRGALMFSLICDWTDGWPNNRDASDLRRHYNEFCCKYALWHVTRKSDLELVISKLYVLWLLFEIIVFVIWIHWDLVTNICVNELGYQWLR